MMTSLHIMQAPGCLGRSCVRYTPPLITDHGVVIRSVDALQNAACFQRYKFTEAALISVQHRDTVGLLLQSEFQGFSGVMAIALLVILHLHACRLNASGVVVPYELPSILLQCHNCLGVTPEVLICEAGCLSLLQR